MPLGALLTLAIIASQAADPSAPAPAAQAAAAAPAPAAPLPAKPRTRTTAKPASAAAAADWDEIPVSAPHDDYGLVAWCYGALDEYLAIYQEVKPDLKDIDKMFGSPVKEAEPYAQDIAGERLALKRFAAAMEAAERASPAVIAPRGAAAVAKGRSIWSAARLGPRRKLADAWLFWGVPRRCETTAKSLRSNATLLGQAMAIDAPTVEASPAPPPPAPPPVADPTAPIAVNRDADAPKAP